MAMTYEQQLVFSAQADAHKREQEALRSIEDRLVNIETRAAHLAELMHQRVADGWARLERALWGSPAKARRPAVTKSLSPPGYDSALLAAARSGDAAGAIARFFAEAT